MNIEDFFLGQHVRHVRGECEGTVSNIVEQPDPFPMTVGLRQKNGQIVNVPFNQLEMWPKDELLIRADQWGTGVVVEGELSGAIEVDDLSGHRSRNPKVGSSPEEGRSPEGASSLAGRASAEEVDATTGPGACAEGSPPEQAKLP